MTFATSSRNRRPVVPRSVRILFLAVLSTCDDFGPVASDPPACDVLDVRLDAKISSLVMGEQLDVRASPAVQGSACNGTLVSWTTSNAQVATVTNFRSPFGTGLVNEVTTVVAVGPGTATVTARVCQYLVVEVQCYESDTLDPEDQDFTIIIFQ